MQINWTLTVSVHASLDALGESAGAALIPASLVYHASSLGLGFAGILTIAPDRAFEESSAAIAGVDAVVFAGRMVPAHLARHVEQDAACNENKHLS